jgi:hypothetical protein
MNYLIKKNYDSIVARGLIDRSTPPRAFVMKLEEEVQEFIDDFTNESNKEREECTKKLI